MTQNLSFQQEIPDVHFEVATDLQNLRGLKQPVNIQSYFADLEEILNELGVNQDHKKELLGLINKKRSKQKLDVISNIFDGRIIAQAELQESSGFILANFSDKITLLAEYTFALIAVDKDIVFCEQIFTNNMNDKNRYKSFEKQLESFLHNIFGNKSSVFAVLLEDEFNGNNSEAKTTFLKSFLDPFIQFYDSDRYDSFIDRIFRIIRDKIIRIPNEIIDLSREGLTGRESDLIRSILTSQNHTFEENNFSKDEITLIDILNQIEDPNERLSALEVYFNTTRNLSANILAHLLVNVPKGQDWGHKSGKSFEALYLDITGSIKGRDWERGGFHNLDILIMYKAIKATKGPINEEQRKLLQDLSQQILNCSLFTKKKKNRLSCRIKKSFCTYD